MEKKRSVWVEIVGFILILLGSGLLISLVISVTAWGFLVDTIQVFWLTLFSIIGILNIYAGFSSMVRNRINKLTIVSAVLMLLTLLYFAVLFFT